MERWGLSRGAFFESKNSGMGEKTCGDDEAFARCKKVHGHLFHGDGRMKCTLLTSNSRSSRKTSASKSILLRSATLHRTSLNGIFRRTYMPRSLWILDGAVALWWTGQRRSNVLERR